MLDREKQQTSEKMEGENEPMSEDKKSKLSSKILNMMMWLEQKGIFYIPSSARGAEVYRKNLFPEFKDGEALLEFLEGKFVVDVGSGTTHKNPYSLINVVGRDSKHDITFLGVEPRVGNEENNVINKAYLKYEIIGEELRRIFKGDFNRLKDRPGEKSVVAGKAEQLPVGKEKVDIILSNYLVSYLIEDEPKMLTIFKEFNDALSENGEIRLFPGTADITSRLFNDQSELGQYMNAHFIADLNVGLKSKATKGTIILRKIKR